MLNNKDFQDIQHALSVKSTLQEINERVMFNATPRTSDKPKHSVDLRSVSFLTGQPMPGKSAKSISLEFMPESGTIIRLPNQHGPVVFAAVVPSKNDPGKVEIQPAPSARIKQLVKDGYTVAKNDEQAFNEYKNSLRFRLQLPVFLEAAERIIYNLFSAIFFRNSSSPSSGIRATEIILIIILAISALISLWSIAILIS